MEVKGKKLLSLVERASTSKVADEQEKSTLTIALGLGGGSFTEHELVTAFLVLVREVAKANGQNSNDPLQLDLSDKKVVKKATKTVSGKQTKNILGMSKAPKTAKAGTIAMIDGVKKRYVGASEKADGTKVKGYWMKVR